MTFIELMLPHVAPFMLVLARLGGLFVFTPILSSPTMPVRAKALLLVILTVATYATIPGEQQVPVALDVFSLGVAVFGEMLIGVVIGLVAMVPVVSAQMGGLVIGQQMGIAIANIYDPSVESESTIVGQMLLYAAMAAYVALGGLEVTLGSLVATFGHVPVGGAWAVMHAGGGVASAGDVFVGMLASGFGLAMRIAAPVLAILFLETAAMAFVMKTMPQLNILSVGFAIKIVAGFVALTISLAAIGEVMRHGDGGVIDALDTVWDWAMTLGGGAEAEAVGVGGGGAGEGRGDG